MKYDLVSIINNYLKSINQKDLTDIQSSIINEINASSFSKLDGLMLSGVQESCYEDKEVPFIKLILINREKEKFNLKIDDEYIELSNSNTNNDFYIKYHIIKNNYGKLYSTKLVRFSFINNDDIIVYNNKTCEHDDTIDLFTNSTSCKRNEGIPELLIPDISIKLLIHGYSYTIMNDSKGFFPKSLTSIDNHKCDNELRKIRCIGEKLLNDFYTYYLFDESSKVLKKVSQKNQE